MSRAQAFSSLRLRVTRKKRGTSSIGNPIKSFKWFFLGCISLITVYHNVRVYPITTPSRPSDIFTSNTDNAAPTMVQYLDPEAVREAKRIQDDFCKSLGSSSPPPEEFIRTRIKAKSVHPLQPAFNIYIYKKQDAVSVIVQKEGGWEKDITHAIIENVNIYARETEKSFSDLTFVDIGANIGWYSMTMASLGMNVVAFEPMARNLNLLRRDLCKAPPKVRDRITLFGHGLSDKEQTCFQYATKFNKGNGIMDCAEREEDIIIDRKKFQVIGKSPLRVLDNVIRTVPQSQLPAGNPALTISALKIDTEGFEPIVFRGGHALLSQAKIPIIFAEYAPQRLMETGGLKSGFEYLENFYNNGYVVYSPNGYKRGRPRTVMPNITVAHALEWPKESDIVIVHESFRAMNTLASTEQLPPSFVV